jgi:hypothetical protein
MDIALASGMRVCIHSSGLTVFRLQISSNRLPAISFITA